MFLCYNQYREVYVKIFDLICISEIGMKVNFYETAEDKLLKFAVVIAKYKDKRVFYRHKERNTDLY